MTRVLVAAQAAVVRAGLAALVAADPALTVVGQSAGGSALATDSATYQPDVILLDLDWHSENPFLFPAKSVTETPSIVLLTDEQRGNWLADALQHGVLGILPREATAEEIIATLQAAANHLVILHPAAMQRLLPLLAVPTPLRSIADPGQSPLTAREVEVLGLLAEGVGNKTIARQMHISEHTVKFHIGSIFTKLGVSSRTEAVTLGARQGLIML